MNLPKDSIEFMDIFFGLFKGCKENLIHINYKEKKLNPLNIIITFLSSFFLIELVCGYYSRSITLLSVIFSLSG